MEVTESLPADVVIRWLRSGDEGVLATVAPDVFDDAVDPDLTREFLADPRHHIVVALVAQLVVGFASAMDYIHPDKPRQLFINEVGVSETWQNRGIGRRLVQEMIGLATNLGCTYAWIGTERHNLSARRCYAAAGGNELEDDVVIVEWKPRTFS
jgi:aminoglycoside 6'-N-acetyltransferase I